MATPEEMIATMIANMKEKTGKTLDQWLAIVKKSKLAKHGEIVKLLKTEHSVTHGFANMIALKYLGTDSGSKADGGAVDLVAAQYAGAKAALKPMYDALIAKIQKFGNDVELAPKNAYVSLRRKKQFGCIQPSTATRLDVGINLKGHPTTDRLEASGSFSAMVSHRVRLTTLKDIDAELIGWLKEAYEGA